MLLKGREISRFPINAVSIMPTIGTARLAKNMGIDNFKMYLIEDFCISLTLILYLNKFTNELNILHGSFKKLG